jgi:hypothetical protein
MLNVKSATRIRLQQSTFLSNDGLVCRSVDAHDYPVSYDERGH